MHILLSVGGLLLIVLLGCQLIFRLLPPMLSWKARGIVHLLVLSFPLISALPLIGGWVHINSLCTEHVPYWDYILDFSVLLLLSFILGGTLLYGGIRLLAMHWLMKRHMTVADPQVQAQIDRWAQLRGVPPVTVYLSAQTRPLALVYGIRRPTLLLSQWMLEHLDEQELEAVVTHELIHILQHDYLVNWIATMLRDAFFYLPTSRRAYRQFRQDKEIACDDLVVTATRRPLALASALTKVWLHLGEQPHSPLVHFFVEQNHPITNRVHRLLTRPSLDHEALRRGLARIRLAVSGVTVPWC